MDDVICEGNETSITNCKYRQDGDNCGGDDGAGVECTMEEHGKNYREIPNHCRLNDYNKSK